MMKAAALAVVCLTALPSAAQPTPSAAVLLNRLVSRYRAIQSYRDTATWRRTAGQKETTATVTLAARRPGQYLLDLEGDKLNTVVACDGKVLLALRTDANVYTRTAAPARLLGADVLGKVDLPTPGARLITLLLEGRLREADSPFAAGLAAATAAPGPDMAGRQTHALKFQYDDGWTATVLVGADDGLVHRLTVVSPGGATIVEDHPVVETGKEIPADVFARSIPDGAKQVASLPPLEEGAPASKFTFVDIQPKANQSLADDMFGTPGNHLRAVPRGPHAFGDSRFSVGERLIHVSGTYSPSLPSFVKGVEVDATFDNLHILHGVQFGGGGEGRPQPVGSEIVTYVLQYGDGSTARLACRYGEHFRDWWDWDQGPQAKLSHAQVAWRGQNPAASAQGRRIRLYSVVWPNPHPEKKVASIGVESAESDCDPFVLAFSLEKR